MNVFLNGKDKDIETALLLEQATVTDIGKSIAYTDGHSIFVNTEENLTRLLPAYDPQKTLKWLLWHERYHNELKHHKRYFDYISEDGTINNLTKREVNIIMDILVHDSLSKMFPELVETATTNLLQFRNRNVLKYTFTTFTLEEMLTEYSEYKKTLDGDTGDTKDTEDTEDTEDTKDTKDIIEEGEPAGGTKEPRLIEDTDDTDDTIEEGEPAGPAKGHKESPDTPDTKDKTPEEHHEDTPEEPKEPAKPEPEHDLTDWSKLDDIDQKEFIKPNETAEIKRYIERLRRKNVRLARLTETLNGLATSTRTRTYAKPSSIHAGKGIMLKGSRPGRAKLYLCFDASGSMGRELETFKEIISKSIPQAMEVPCEWFTDVYGKGKFKDIMGVYASSGFNDDGDRTIELCWKAEQEGYTPIGVTDGGGRISWSEDMIKQLKRTILVGQDREWLEAVKRKNPNIQILDI